MKITGVEILNEGSGISIDDAVTEFQASFVARFVEPWQAVTSPFSSDTINSVTIIRCRLSCHFFHKNPG